MFARRVFLDLLFSFKEQIPKREDDFSEDTEINVEEDKEGGHYYSKISFKQKHTNKEIGADEVRSSSDTTSISTRSMTTSPIADVNPAMSSSVLEESTTSAVCITCISFITIERFD